MRQERKTLLLALSKKLNYQFSDIALLELALSHRSIGSKNNERMEFLGDAVINFLIAEAVFDKYVHAKEGDLSRLRASLVSRDALGELAKDFQLGDYLLLGPGEMRSGGHKRDSILSCAMEAVIGAVYLDTDFVSCKKTVLHWFTSRLDALSIKSEYRDFKTQLQEYVQSRHLSLPKYILLKCTGKAHDQIFYVQCEVKSLSLVAEAHAETRRKAEKLAAKGILDQLS